jgi:hypothetical protein
MYVYGRLGVHGVGVNRATSSVSAMMMWVQCRPAGFTEERTGRREKEPAVDVRELLDGTLV